MLITEWQSRFLAAVQSRVHNVYPAVMIKALLRPETNAVLFGVQAAIYFKRYEAESVTTTQINLDVDPLSPRGLWNALRELEEEPAAMLTEEGAPVLTEDGVVIQLESFLS